MMAKGASEPNTCLPYPARAQAAESAVFPFTLGAAAYTVAQGWLGVGARNADAMIKARAILARGFRALNGTTFGVALMSVEQASAAVQEANECRTGAEWVAFQGKLAGLATRRLVDAACMLSTMAVQVSEDALVPLTRRIEAVAEEFLEASAA
jgi:hypothetical protein